MPELKMGGKLASTVCTTEVIVVKAPGGDVDLTCGGAPMVDPTAAGEATSSPAEGAAEGTLLGKRYVNDDESLEVLCTKPGDGSLGVGGVALELKEAKPLPASD
ncbi:MAG: hypothetical protein OES57_12515 [Acidimicrobiia bacterium]|nr:hypothetical protein [Acidimicrobiia bacterium]